jgi:hypothetical protein
LKKIYIQKDGVFKIPLKSGVHKNCLKKLQK